MLLPTLLVLSLAPIAEETPEVEALDCSTVKADRIATLDSAKPFREKVSPGTGGTAYAGKNGKCKRFVVDFDVLANAQPPNGYHDFFEVSARLTDKPGKKKCKDAVLWVTTYEKAAGATSFAKQTTAKYEGEWLDGHGYCWFDVRSPALPRDRVDPAGTSVWRVATKARIGDDPVGVTARIGFVMKVPG
jgi:hypothetical protein